MIRCYIDSSALVKRFVEEAGTTQVLDVINKADRVMVSRLTMVEVISAIVRRSRVDSVLAAQLDSLLAVFDRELRGVFEVIELDAAILVRSTELVRMYTLRAADAIQLACALSVSGTLEQRTGLIFVSADSELNSAAESERFSILNPMG